MTVPAQPPAQAPEGNQTRRERMWIYVVACVILVAMALWAILAYTAVRETARAQQKADTMIAALEDAGFGAPDRNQIVRVLGEDGGATCDNPNKALSRATLLALLTNGASGPGARPVIADSRAVQGQLLIIEIYCPAELEEFQLFIDNLKTSDVAGTRQ